MTSHRVTESNFTDTFALCLLLAFTFLLPSTGLVQVSPRSVPTLPFLLRNLSSKVSSPTENAHVEGTLLFTSGNTGHALSRGDVIARSDRILISRH